MATQSNTHDKHGAAFTVPAWASFLTPGEYADFTRLVSTELHQRGLTVRLDDGLAIASGAGGQEQRLGMLNLAQMCKAEPPRGWPRLISSFCAGLLRSNEEAAHMVGEMRDLDRVRGKIKVRLHPDDYLHLPHAGQLVLTPIADGICGLLVCDLGYANISVPREFASGWRVPIEELFALGLSNVRAQGRLEVKEAAQQSGFTVDRLAGGSNYAASHVLCLEDYLEPGPGYGAIVSVPQRHLIFTHVIRDRSFVEAIRFLHRATAEAHDKGPGSISKQLYWWRPGRLLPLQTPQGATSIGFQLQGSEFQHEVIEPMMMTRGN